MTWNGCKFTIAGIVRVLKISQSKLQRTAFPEDNDQSGVISSRWNNKLCTRKEMCLEQKDCKNQYFKNHRHAIKGVERCKIVEDGNDVLIFMMAIRKYVDRVEHTDGIVMKSHLVNLSIGTIFLYSLNQNNNKTMTLFHSNCRTHSHFLLCHFISPFFRKNVKNSMP
jgi:hypothetical protein